MTLKRQAKAAGMTTEAFVIAAFERHQSRKGAAQELNVSEDYFGKLLRKAGVQKFKRRTPDQEQAIIKAVMSGERVKEVAKKHQLTVSAVNALIKRNGLRRQTKVVLA